MKTEYKFIIYILAVLACFFFAYKFFTPTLAKQSNLPVFNLGSTPVLNLGATVLFPGGGGTGTGTPPVYGQVLVGNSSGTYTLTATSSLGIVFNGNIPGDPFTFTTNFGRAVAATGTPLWLQAGVMASSTSWFDGVNAKLASSSAATTTDSQYFSFLTGSTQCLQVDTTGKLSGTGSACAGAGAGFPFTMLTNFGVTMAATGTPIWGQAGLFASSTSVFASTTFTGAGLVGIGTTSPYAILSVHANNAPTVRTLFAIGSTTAGVHSTLFSVTNTGAATVRGSLTVVGDSSVSSGDIGWIVDDVGIVSDDYGVVVGGNYGETVSGRYQIDTTLPIELTGSMWATGNLSIGTTTPFGRLAVGLHNGGTAPLFNLASSSTGVATSTLFLVTGGVGNIGIGTTSPFGRFTLDRTATLASSSIIVTEYRAATSTAATIDCRTSNQHKWRIGASATTLTLTGMVAGQKCIVVVENPNGTAGAVTWAVTPGILLWVGGTLPTQTTTANKQDVWSFLATQGSSTLTILGAQSASF